MSAIDHAAESEKIAEHLGETVIAEEGITDATIIATQLDALRHATLAVAEQLRLANLLTLSATASPHRASEIRVYVAERLHLDEIPRFHS